MSAKPTPLPEGGQVVPLRRLDERRSALSEISDEALLAARFVQELVVPLPRTARS